MNQHLHKHKQLSEDELLKAYLEEGDELAYGKLYSLHLPKLDAALKEFLKNTNLEDKQHAHDEIIQKTLENLHNSKSFKNKKVKDYQSYLFIILKNTFINYSKNTKKQIAEQDEYQKSQPIVVEESLTEEMEIKHKKVNEAIEKLNSEKQKEAIILRMSGHSYRMIAKKMGTEEGRIRNYINRGKKAIRKILGIQP